MAYIINIETSTEVCSVALSNNGEMQLLRESDEGLNHSKLLPLFIDEIFKETGLRAKFIDAIAVSMGPGSYTGLRIGVSLAKGLCYSLDIPLIAIGTLDAMGIYTGNNIKKYSGGMDMIQNDLLCCPMIDARRMEVYTALYNLRGEKIEDVNARIIREDTFSKYLEQHQIMFFGNGSTKCKTILNHPNALFNGPLKNSARFMLELAENKFNSEEFEDVAYFEPFYLKDFIATVPVNKIIK